MRIYTKSGDDGKTGLTGGMRVFKDSIFTEAFGAVDELNSFVGLALIEVKDTEVKELLNQIQNFLFILGSDISAPDKEGNKNIPRILTLHCEEIERAIDKFSARLEDLRNFILPGGYKSSALLHVCRTVCRRAERRIVTLYNGLKTEAYMLIFINRLSDLFFVLARYENKISGIEDIKWQP